MLESIKLGKVFACLALIVLLVTSIGMVKRGDATSTSVFLEPSSQTVGTIGAAFTINVSVAGASNLYGYDLKVYYNSTLMNGTQVTEGPFLNESGSFQPFFSIGSFTDHYNSSEGVAWISSTLMGSVPGVNGGGVLVTIEFKSLALGNSIPSQLADVALSDPNASPIPYEILSGGTVTVVPELTSLIIVLTLVTASILIILGKKRTVRRTKSGISTRDLWN
jgi:hypothetical protein